MTYVPDDPPLFDDLSVGEHLDFIGRLYRVTDHHEKSIGLLRQFELLDKYKACENAISVTYPHHQQSEGIAMMLRTKLTFLGKGTVIVVSLCLLVAWATLCRSSLPEPYASTLFVSDSIAAPWTAAILGLAAATLCWRRFDVTFDTPPE